MSEQEKQESQKTVVAFIAGLLIGGLLVWVFGGSPDDTNKALTDEQAPSEESSSLNENSDSGDLSEASDTPDAPVRAELPTGTGDVTVTNQAAGESVSLESATFPSDEGWVGVRDYDNDQLGYILGVARYSKEQGLIPEEVPLQRATMPGETYAIVFYSENGDREFNLAADMQIGDVAETFVAQ